MPTSFAGSLSPNLQLQPGSRVPPPSPTSRTESLFCRVFILLGVGPPFSLARFDENINFYDSATPSGCFQGDGDGQFFWKGGLHQLNSKSTTESDIQQSAWLKVLAPEEGKGASCSQGTHVSELPESP